MKKYYFLLSLFLCHHTYASENFNDVLHMSDVNLFLGQSYIDVDEDTEISGWNYGASGSLMLSNNMYVSIAHSKFNLTSNSIGIPDSKLTEFGFGYISDSFKNLYFSIGTEFLLYQLENYNFHGQVLYTNLSYVPTSSPNIMFTYGISAIDFDYSSSIQASAGIGLSILLYENLSMSYQFSVDENGLSFAVPFTLYIPSS